MSKWPDCPHCGQELAYDPTDDVYRHPQSGITVEDCARLMGEDDQEGVMPHPA